MDRMPDIDFFVPPRVNNVDGETRHVGVEIEYAGISAKDSAEIVRELLGGSVVADSPHRHRVEGTELGDFVCELDFQYAHPSMDPKKDSEALRELDSRLSEMIGDASASFVPVEIASPPLPFDMLPSLEPLIGALRRAGALGTNEGFSYAFGLHLNPEVADDSAEWITAVPRAYLILSDWLRAEIDIDLTRRLFRFADPFPKDYLRLVCDPQYHPDRSCRAECPWLLSAPV